MKSFSRSSARALVTLMLILASFLTALSGSLPAVISAPCRGGFEHSEVPRFHLSVIQLPSLHDGVLLPPRGCYLGVSVVIDV